MGKVQKHRPMNRYGKISCVDLSRETMFVACSPRPTPLLLCFPHPQFIIFALDAPAPPLQSQLRSRINTSKPRSIVIRTHQGHKTLYIIVFLRSTFSPDNYRQYATYPRDSTAQQALRPTSLRHAKGVPCHFIATRVTPFSPAASARVARRDSAPRFRRELLPLVRDLVRVA